jgi:hypothetical protein
MEINTTRELAHGIYAGNAVISGTALTVSTGSLSYGIFSAAGSAMDLTQMSVSVTDGYSGAAAMARSTMTLRNASITVSGSYSDTLKTIGIGTSSGAVITLIDSSIMTDGGAGLRFNYSGANNESSTINMIGGSINTGTGPAIGAASNGLEAHGQLNISQMTVDSGLLYYNNDTADVSMNIDDSDLSNAGGIMLDTASTGTTRINVTRGTGIHGDITNSGSGPLTLTADYDNLNYGLSLELGKKYPLHGGGWRQNAHIEPTLQLSYQHIDAKDHTTTGAQTLAIKARDMDTLQLRFGYTLSKPLPLRTCL